MPLIYTMLQEALLFNGQYQANVAPIFKKGSKLQAVNYRPVSLTCITCKLFQHIICKHILVHLEDHNFFYRSSTWLQVRKIM